MIRVVWFKRDLRVVDHAPLRHAADSGGPVLPLWIAEPTLLGAPDASARQLAFARECAAELDGALATLGAPLRVAVGDAVEVFARLRDALGGFELLSHEETGNEASYARDRAVARWARENGVRWRQWPSNGVVRRLGDRDRWSGLWMQRMQPPPLPAPARLVPATGLPPGVARFAAADAPDALDTLARAAGRPAGDTDAPGRQPGGRSRALACLDRFLDEPLGRYRAGMASPLTAPDDCSRLSPHLAYGTVSIRELAHATWNARRTETDPARRAGLKSFESRLHWHCHFIQKLESEPAIEHRNPHRGFDGLRNEGEPDAAERERLDAWREGRTGWPIVDACMRMLAHTGWLNFRMRAMLASIAAYPLWLHWREPGLHLARLFVDYEPGIHWPQMHMQSGVTGINATRVYSPARQQHEQDPDGRFVRAWIPELGTAAYPPPIVDWAEAARLARERVWAVRRDPQAQRVAHAVWARHGSRHPAREPARGTRRTVPADVRQLGLDFGD